MQDLTAFLGIAAALALGAASPGPSFVLVARTAAATSRAAGLASALGMGVGGLLFAVAALAGLQALLLSVPSLYLLMKLAGGLYLAYLGIRIWRGAGQALPSEAAGAGAAGTPPFLLALATQLSNPKAAVVYASVFAAFLPAQTSLAFNLSLAATVFAVETGWYSLVALLLSSPAPRSAYLRGKAWVDRAAGGVMVALGLKLALSAHRA